MMKKIIAMMLVIGTFVCSANTATANAGEEDLLKKITVTEGIELTPNNLGIYDEVDTVVRYSNLREVEMPYYVGKEKTSFLKGKEYDEVLYLGTPYYLPMLNEKAVYFSVSDNTVASIEGNTLIGKKQGLVTVTAYNAKKVSIGDTVFAVTTYNDGKDVINAVSSDFSKTRTWEWHDTKYAEYWKVNVNTIQDMCNYLQARRFVYDFGKEPEFLNAGRWQWTADPETIFSMSGGVCIQVAQMGAYMLSDNFEDWGCIMITGNQGHIFNWFYEDGYYYVMDFTEVICDNRDYGQPEEFRSYSKSIQKFKTMSQLKKWVTTDKVDVTQNFIITMYSCHGYDRIPVSYDTGCSDTRAVTEGRNKETAYYGFNEKVDADVLFIREDLNIEFRHYSIDEMPWQSIYGGLYGYEVDNTLYFDYTKH